MRKSKFAVWLVALCQVVSLVFHSVAMAQSTAGVGDKLPVIEHTVSTATPDDPYTFTAKVTDDSKVANVTLLYRFSDVAEFQKLDMIAGSDNVTYSVRIPKEARRNGIIKYYFAAFDDQGNASVSNFAFTPLSRVVDVDDTSVVSEGPAVAPSVTEVAAQPAETGRRFKTWQIVLGVLAVGAVAGLAAGGGSSGGGGSSAGDSTCAGTGCSIRLVLPPPTN